MANHIETINKLIDKIRQEMDATTAEIKRLRADQSRVHLDDAVSHEPIVPRTRVAFRPMFAKTYYFVYESDFMDETRTKRIPICGVLEPADSTFLDKVVDTTAGKYFSRFLPHWYGRSSDIDMRVKIYTNACYHPSSIAKIKELEKKNLALSKQIAEHGVTKDQNMTKEGYEKQLDGTPPNLYVALYTTNTHYEYPPSTHFRTI